MSGLRRQLCVTAFLAVLSCEDHAHHSLSQQAGCLKFAPLTRQRLVPKGRITALTFLLLLPRAAVTMPDAEYHACNGIEPKCNADYESKADVHREDTRENSSDY